MNSSAAVLHAPRDLRIEERPVPTPTDTEVLVEVTATGICGSDVHYNEHGRIGDLVVTSPMAIRARAGGHLTSGSHSRTPSRR